MNGHTRQTRATIVLALAVAGSSLNGCGNSDEPSAQTLDVPETAAIGVLPEPVSSVATLPPPPPPPTTEGASTTVPDEEDRLTAPIAEQAGGDRVLMIGDGTLASATPPEDSRMCDALTLFGWEAEMAARAGADPTDLLDARFRPDDDLDWDVVAVYIGSELPLDDDSAVEDVTTALDRILDEVSPRPTIVYTVNELSPRHEELNDAIRERADDNPNVLLIDWNNEGGAASEVLDDDGVTLTTDGLKRLSVLTAAALGEAPSDQVGDCNAAPDLDGGN